MATKAQMGEEIADLLVERRALEANVDELIALVQARDEELEKLKREIETVGFRMGMGTARSPEKVLAEARKHIETLNLTS